MNIKLETIKIKTLFKGFEDNGDDGVTAYGNNLIVRPPYQREFVYSAKQQEEVIKTVEEGLPLNSMYWVKREDGKFEVLDGQQRILSICNYLDGDFSKDFKFWHNLDKKQQKIIDNYELQVYIVEEGSKSDKMKWFERINVAGEKLSTQELRNANYTVAWLVDAKKRFSKPGCAAYSIGKKLIKEKLNRQGFLQVALKWISTKNGEAIEDYMAKHQNDKNANELWEYFEEVVDWVNEVFPNTTKEMKGLDWGKFYNDYNHIHFDPFTDEVEALMADADVTKKRGIYLYLLSGEEKHLSIRAFTSDQITTAFTKQKGVCVKCEDTFKIEEMEADHITPWSKGGKTDENNLQMLCKKCNRTKSNK